MAIKIGHASIDENRKISGGKTGDNNGKEVCIREWYDKNWTYVMRPKDFIKAEKMAKACEDGCSNNNIGYDQGQRNSLYNLAKSNGYELSTVGLCECDCSSFMTVCAIAGGVTSLEYKGNAPTTSTMKSKFNETGEFEILTDSKYLTSDKYLKRGDILVKPGIHTIMILENGHLYNENVQNPVGSSSSIGIDVSGYNKITDYGLVKSDGVKFAILKIMKKDLNVDTLFETHLNGFKSVGIPIMGVYNYSYATDVNKAVTDANKVIQYLRQYKLKTKVYLDVEDKCQMNLGSILIDIINAYQNAIESAGFEFGLYTGMSFYNSYIKPYKKQMKCNDEWIARYYNSYNKMLTSDYVNELKKPSIGVSIEGWQYTSSGSVKGIVGNVDLNIFYGKTNGSLDDPAPPLTNAEAIYYECTVATKSSNLLVRALEDNQFIKTGKYLPKGTSGVYVLDIYNGYGKISNNNEWVSLEYLDPNKRLTVIANGLNFRRSDCIDSTSLCVKTKNTVVKVFSRSSNGWYLTEFGWCSGKPEYVLLK